MSPRRDRGRRGARAAAAAAVALAAALAPARPAGADGEAPAPAYTTVVHAGGGPAQPVGTAVGADESRGLAGTGGDPALAAQDLPGVARPAPGATGVVVWGAAPAESRVLFDDVEIPALYHFGGFRSAVGAELVGRIDVVPGAYGAEYGRALGGLVRVESRPLEAGTHLALDASLLDAAASLRAAPAAGLRVAAAARASYLDATYGRYAPAGATALFPIPRYADAQILAALDVGPGATLRAFALASSDRVRRTLGAAPAAGLPEPAQDQGLRWWRAGISYSERGDDDGVTATLWAGGDHPTLDETFGAALASQAIDRLSLGLRARYRARLGAGARVTLGLDGLVERARARRAGSLSIPPREGDVVVFGQPPGADANADSWSAVVGDVAPYVTATLSRGPFTLTPGLRAGAFPVDGSRALPPVGATPPYGYARVGWAIDPRLALAFAPAPGLTLTAAAGLYHQPVDPADLSAVFGSPALGATRAAHGALSVWKRLGAAGSVEATGFYRRVDDLAVRSPLPTPALAGALVPDGGGRSFGGELLLCRQLAGNGDGNGNGNGTTAWLGYTLGRSERWTAGGPTRLFDFDQTHVLTAVARHRRGAWAASARARYATGMPRTPVTGAFLDARDGVFQPIFGAQNSARLPPFFQLDARVDRSFAIGRAEVTLYLDVQNLTDRRNAEEKVYAADYLSSSYLTGLPLLALFGVRIAS
jgi:hypothetical protein